MPSIYVRLTAPFAVGDLVSRVDLEDGKSLKLVLRDGRLKQKLPARATKFFLCAENRLEGAPALKAGSLTAKRSPRGQVIDIACLFNEGMPVPPDGRLVLRLRWGLPCHADEDPGSPTPEGPRFLSWEHILCAAFIGMDASKDDALPLDCHGVTADFRHDTLLPVNEEVQLTFGQIIALAGDFYAHLDTQASKEFSWAWPRIPGFTGWLLGDYRSQTLVRDEPETVFNLLKIFERDKTADRGTVMEFITAAEDSIIEDFPARRYLALASRNYCHFQNPRPGMDDGTNEALRLYRAYHQRALKEAQAAPRSHDPRKAFLRALAVDAFGCHFLTDLFASGHVRVPRRLIDEQYGVVSGGLFMSKTMHGEDNRLGLWCTTRRPSTPRQVWRVFGDGELRKHHAAQNRIQVSEAVRRSAAELFTGFCGCKPTDGQAAEDIIPVPLAPGEGPLRSDSLLGPKQSGAEAASQTNQFPLHWFTGSGTIASRVGGPYEDKYRVDGKVVSYRDLARLQS